MKEIINNPWFLAFLFYGVLIGVFGLIFIVKYYRRKTKK